MEIIKIYSMAVVWESLKDLRYIWSWEEYAEVGIILTDSSEKNEARTH